MQSELPKRGRGWVKPWSLLKRGDKIAFQAFRPTPGSLRACLHGQPIHMPARLLLCGQVAPDACMQASRTTGAARIVVKARWQGCSGWGQGLQRAVQPDFDEIDACGRGAFFDAVKATRKDRSLSGQ